MVAKPAGNLWQADFHPTATREHQSGNRLISEDLEISESKYKLNKKYKKHLHKPNKITTFAAELLCFLRNKHNILTINVWFAVWILQNK